MSARETLAEMRAIEQAATEGPWVWEKPSDEEWPMHAESLVSDSGADVLYGWGYDASGIEGSSEDRAFIADARTALPKALDALEAVLALWPDTADPCDCCVHVDCEVVRAITEALT